MNIENLYDIAEKENIKIYNWHIEDVNGMYLNYENINAIALNYDRLGTYVDEKCTLAEELRSLLYGCHLPCYMYWQSFNKQTRISC